MENSDLSSLDTLKDNLLRAVDAEYNVIKAEIVLDIITQLEEMKITKDQLQTTRLGREINTIRQKLDARKKNEPLSELFIEIAQRAKKLLRSWQGLLNNSSSILSTNNDIKHRLILKVKFNSSTTKRKHDFDIHTNHKRKKIEVIQTPIPSVVLTETNNSTLPRVKTTQQLFMEMQLNETTKESVTSPSNTILTSDTNVNWEIGNNIDSTSVEQSNKSSTDLASFHTVADLVEDHRRRMLIEHDSRELEARPDLLLVPIDQLAFVYERERNQELNISSKFQHSSMTIVEKLNQSMDFIALPFIDCPLEFNLILDELTVQHPTKDM